MRARVRTLAYTSSRAIIKRGGTSPKTKKTRKRLFSTNPANNRSSAQRQPDLNGKKAKPLKKKNFGFIRISFFTGKFKDQTESRHEPKQCAMCNDDKGKKLTRLPVHAKTCMPVNGQKQPVQRFFFSRVCIYALGAKNAIQAIYGGFWGIYGCEPKNNRIRQQKYTQKRVCP